MKETQRGDSDWQSQWRLGAGVYIYEAVLIFLLLVVITPEDASFVRVLANPFATLRVDNTALLLLLASLIPFILPHLRSLKIFGAELELKEQVNRMSREVEEVKRETTYNQFKQQAAMFTIATSLSRNMFLENTRNRRSGSSLAEIPLSLARLDFVESWIVTALVHELLRAHESACPDKFRVGPLFSAEPTLLTFFRLLSGKIDMFLWYSGTGIRMADKTFTDEQAADPVKVRDRLNEVYEPLGLTWLDSLGFENEEYLVMLESRARQLGIRTMEELKGCAHALVFAANQEYFLRDWRYPRLLRQGMEFRDSIDTLDLNDRVSGLIRREFDVGVISETDPEFEQTRGPHRTLRVIEPDATFPGLPQYAMPICRSDVVDKDIGNDETLGSLMSRIKIDTQTMRDLNREAARQGLRHCDGLVLDGIVKRFAPDLIQS